MLTLDPTPPAASAIAATPTLTIDAKAMRSSLRYAAQREAGSAALYALMHSSSTSEALKFGCMWGRAALDDVIEDRARSIRDCGGLLHYGAPGVAA